MREVLGEESGVRMDAWLDACEAELVPLAAEYSNRGEAVLAEMKRNAVRREFGRSAAMLHRGYYSRNPAMCACFRNVKRGRILKNVPRRMNGVFEYLFDSEDALLGVIRHPEGEGDLLCFCRILRRADGFEYDLDYTRSDCGIVLNHIWRYEMDGDRIVSELLFDACMGKASKLWYFKYGDDGILEAFQFEFLLPARLRREKLGNPAAALLIAIPENTHRWYMRCRLKRDTDGTYREIQKDMTGAGLPQY